MRTRALSLSLSAALALFAAAPGALADTITLTSGEVLEDVKLQTEGLTAITYKKGSAEKELATAEVASIAYERKPDLLEVAEVELADDNLGQAIYNYTLYVEGVVGGNTEKRYPWAPAYAAQRAMDLNLALGDNAKAIAAADLLLANFADSRHVPGTLLTKSEAQAAAGDVPAAIATLDQLVALAGENRLDERWALESELRKARIDPSLSLEQRLEAFEKLGKSAADVPSISARVKLASSETQLELADKEPSRQDELLGAARGLLEELQATEGLDTLVRAGLYTGLGDVVYLEAGNDPVKLAEARDYYLRVVVLFPDEGRYVPKAMAFAALTSSKLATPAEGDPEKARAKKLGRRMIQRYPNSRWTDVAKSAMR